MIFHASTSVVKRSTGRREYADFGWHRSSVCLGFWENVLDWFSEWQHFNCPCIHRPSTISYWGYSHLPCILWILLQSSVQCLETTTSCAHAFPSLSVSFWRKACAGRAYRCRGNTTSCITMLSYNYLGHPMLFVPHFQRRNTKTLPKVCGAAQIETIRLDEAIPSIWCINARLTSVEPLYIISSQLPCKVIYHHYSAVFRSLLAASLP